jgi:hypothetical protein
MMQRGTGKHKHCITIKDFYDSYLDKNPKDSKYYLTKKEFLEINKDLCEEYGNFVVNDAGILQLGFNLGSIAVTKRKRRSKRLSIDWGESNKEGELIYNFNDHSMGYRYKAFWNKRYSKIINKSYYSFYFVRTLNRQLASNIKNKVIDYFQFI